MTGDVCLAHEKRLNKVHFEAEALKHAFTRLKGGKWVVRPT